MKALTNRVRWACIIHAATNHHHHQPAPLDPQLLLVLLLLCPLRSLLLCSALLCSTLLYSTQRGNAVTKLSRASLFLSLSLSLCVCVYCAFPPPQLEKLEESQTALAEAIQRMPGEVASLISTQLSGELSGALVRAMLRNNQTDGRFGRYDFRFV
jgi:hypothetical protein